MSLIRVRFLKDAPPYAAGELAGFAEEKVVQLEKSGAAVRDVDPSPAEDGAMPGREGVGAGGADTASGADADSSQETDPSPTEDTAHAPARGSARARRG